MAGLGAFLRDGASLGPARAAVLARQALAIDPESAALRRAATELQRLASTWATTSADARRKTVDAAAADVAAEAARVLADSPIRATAPGARRPVRRAPCAPRSRLVPPRRFGALRRRQRRLDRKGHDDRTASPVNGRRDRCCGAVRSAAHGHCPPAPAPRHHAAAAGRSGVAWSPRAPDARLACGFRGRRSGSRGRRGHRDWS